MGAWGGAAGALVIIGHNTMYLIESLKAKGRSFRHQQCCELFLKFLMASIKWKVSTCLLR